MRICPGVLINQKGLGSAILTKVQMNACSWLSCVQRKLGKVSQSFNLGHVLATLSLWVTLLDLKKGLSSFVICPIGLKLPVIWVGVRPVDLELHNEITFGVARCYAVLSHLNRRLIGESSNFHFGRHQEIHLMGLVRLSLCSDSTVRRAECGENRC